MITIEIAGIPIAINSRYNIEKQQYNGYITEKQPLEIVTASDEEIRLEGTVVSAYTEQLCILRKIALLCVNYSAFLFHAAVIDVDGQGIAFAAQSGTGKTTRVLLWKKAMSDRVKVVNGDKPILREIGRKYQCVDEGCVLYRTWRHGRVASADTERSCTQAIYPNSDTKGCRTFESLHDAYGTIRAGYSLLFTDLQSGSGRSSDLVV